MLQPYFDAGDVQLYLGDMRQILPQLDIAADCVIADPPYGETALAWDRWPEMWPDALIHLTKSMWCFGSMKMFMARVTEFGAWKFSQDVVWRKHNGSGFAADRFRRVHEHANHWYRGRWADVYHHVPIVPHDGPWRGTRKAARAGTAHLGANNGHNRPWLDDGTRLSQSVLTARSMHGRAVHPTEKPVDILQPLVEYACPVGGLVLDPFAGSGSTAIAARAAERRAVLIEADERYCEVIAKRLTPAEAGAR